MHRSSGDPQVPHQHLCMLRATLSLLLSVLALSISGPSSKASQLGNKAKVAKPSCIITTIDAQTGIITATENATGRVFSFQAFDSTLLHSLKVGQGIYANFTTHQVSIDGINVCGKIISFNEASNRGDTASASLGPVPSLPSTCCAVTSINAQTGMAKAQVNATRRVFSFEVPNSALMNSLRVGQRIYANLPPKKSP